MRQTPVPATEAPSTPSPTQVVPPGHVPPGYSHGGRQTSSAQSKPRAHCDVSLHGKPAGSDPAGTHSVLVASPAIQVSSSSHPSCRVIEQAFGVAPGVVVPLPGTTFGSLIP